MISNKILVIKSRTWEEEMLSLKEYYVAKHLLRATIYPSPVHVYLFQDSPDKCLVRSSVKINGTFFKWQGHPGEIYW